MPTYGKFGPQPERYGGARSSLKIIFDALNKGRGTAYDVGESSNVAVENFAIARSIWEVWETNRRVSLQTDPRGVSGPGLGRWERIFGLPTQPSDTETDRRVRVGAVFERFGSSPNASFLDERLTAALGPVFVGVRHITLDEAVVWWPGGKTNPDIPWSSTVAHILVQTRKPYGFSEQQFYDAVGRVAPTLDPIVPAWVTLDWYRDGDGHTGPWPQDPEAGFYLDDEHNLDNEIFDD